MQGIENGRAKFAYDCVQNVNSDHLSNYLTNIRKMPSMIQINGLAQTIAFYLSKNKEGHAQIIEHLSAWIFNDETRQRLGLEDSENNLQKLVISVPGDIYHLITVETMAYLDWLKRFATARNVMNKSSDGD